MDRHSAGGLAWADVPKDQPPSAAYDVLEYGLMVAPAISAGAHRQELIGKFYALCGKN